VKKISKVEDLGPTSGGFKKKDVQASGVKESRKPGYKKKKDLEKAVRLTKRGGGRCSLCTVKGQTDRLKTPGQTESGRRNSKFPPMEKRKDARALGRQAGN